MNARRAVSIVVGTTAAVMLWAAPAFANDHLADANNAPSQRDFVNPVTANPSGTSGAAAQPGTVPGQGDPNAGEDTSTPAVDLSDVFLRSGGHAQP
jgi:hypothetical protein